MSIHLSPEMLEATYDLLRLTPPFKRWKLPPGEEISFFVQATDAHHAEYKWEGDHHRIGVSIRKCGTLTYLLVCMAHEMVHLYQRLEKTENTSQHNQRFHVLASRVCRHHGFDRKTF